MANAIRNLPTQESSSHMQGWTWTSTSTGEYVGIVFFTNTEFTSLEFCRYLKNNGHISFATALKSGYFQLGSLTLGMGIDYSTTYKLWVEEKTAFGHDYYIIHISGVSLDHILEITKDTGYPRIQTNTLKLIIR